MNATRVAAGVRSRRTHRWSVWHKLIVTAILGSLTVIATVTVGALGLTASGRTADSMQRLLAAMNVHQTIDMRHEGVLAIVSVGVLEADHGNLAGYQTAVTDLDRVSAEMRSLVSQQLAGELPPAVRTEIEGVTVLVDRYLDEGAEVLRDVETSASGFSSKHFATFRKTFVELEDHLSHITAGLLEATNQATRDNSAARRQALTLMLGTAAVSMVIAGLSAVLILRSITRSLSRVGAAAVAVTAGDLSARTDVAGNDEVGRLGITFNRLADSLQEMVERLRDDAENAAFGKELSAAFEMVDTEREVYDVVQRAMTAACGPAKIDLLLADSGQAHLEVAAIHPEHGSAGCGVELPFGCVAVRRGSTAVFRTSEALDSCPKLVGRESSALTAVCAPVSFMGKALGVIHATRPSEAPFSQEEIERIDALAAGAGTRIGTVRAFQKTQLQASTDGLTGLMNRRSMEERVGLLIERGQPFAMAVADLDHFKQLNDTFGHHAGDRALRVFAEIMRTTTRTEDMIARWGGEEFTIVLPDLSADDAAAICDRIRENLLAATASGSLPPFTASFGVTDSRGAQQLEDLFRIADEALYSAKDHGRNRVAIGPVLDRPTADGPAEMHSIGLSPPEPN